LPGLRVDPADTLVGAPAGNFQHGDFDQDGLADLVMADGVWFQRAGGYAAADRVALPETTTAGRLAVWKARLYCWQKNTLTVFVWAADRWTVAHAQALPWHVWLPADATPRRRLERFLIDRDHDGIPELVGLSAAGVHTYTWDGEAYIAAPVLRCWPALQPVAESSSPLWPPSAREVAIPSRRRNHGLALDDRGALVVIRDGLPNGRVQFSVVMHAWNGPDANVAEAEFPAMPDHVRACYLNTDGTTDFAGSRYVDSVTRTALAPIRELMVSLDGGASFMRKRSASIGRDHPAFADWDGDGALDWIVESTGLFDGGPREWAARLLTGRRIAHRVRVYRQTGAGFEAEPSVDLTATFELEEALVNEGPVSTIYRTHGEGRCNLLGDVDGDGYNDAVVRVRLNEVAVYRLGPDAGTPPAPAWTAPIAGDERLRVADINADGRADLVMQPDAGLGASPDGATRVLFSMLGADGP